MKSIIITEEQLKDLNEVGNDLFNDENDPRSHSYIRVLKRPEINWFRVALSVLLPCCFSVLLFFFLTENGISVLLSASISVIVLLLYSVAFMKKMILCLVRIYQRYAPANLRNKCRFEPSCSQYMILAVEKYGVVKGLKMGILRLKRCNINNGGFDYP